MQNIKINRTYSIDLEIAKLLDNEKNKSEIVNELLKKYYKGALKNEKSLVP